IDLPIEIRETLRDFVQKNRHYRTEVKINAEVRRTGHGVLVEIKVDSTVVASADTVYRQYFAGESAERVHLMEAAVTYPLSSKRSYSEKDIKLKPKEDEPGVFAWRGKKFCLYKNQRLR